MLLMSSSAVNALSAKPSVIDSTRDINFDIDGISATGNIDGYDVGHSSPRLLLPSHLSRVLQNPRHRLPLQRRRRVG